jgi:hypothetical protein
MAIEVFSLAHHHANNRVGSRGKPPAAFHVLVTVGRGGYWPSV